MLPGLSLTRKEKREKHSKLPRQMEGSRKSRDSTASERVSTKRLSRITYTHTRV